VPLSAASFHRVALAKFLDDAFGFSSHIYRVFSIHQAESSSAAAAALAMLP